MVHISVIEARLAKLDFKTSPWFRPEVRELQHILMDNEQLINCVQGRYFGGLALLVATDIRLLLIDKKIPYLSVEDIRYDMISEIDYSTRLFDATVTIYTVNKQHHFNSWKHKHHLRNLTTYAQQRIMGMRHYQQHDTQMAPGIDVSMIRQAYSYNNQAQAAVSYSPSLQAPARTRLPAPHTPHVMGAAAVHGARQWVNPYTKGSFMMRKQFSRPD